MHYTEEHKMQIKEYIVDQIAKGFSKEDIEEKLVRSGWDEEAVRREILKI
jgi:hypothetical protein